MSYNSIGLLKANGEVEEYGNTGSGNGANFVGTQSEWNSLTTEQQNQYDTIDITDDNEENFFADFVGAGFHNSLYRGKYLGNSVTSAQYDAIDAGTFDDMFIGDYWTIGGIVYRIAAFDYWYNCGDTACTTHHVVPVPDTCIGENQKMNDSNTTTGGYVGSKMYTTNLASAKSTITSAFGSAHILSHRELLSNTVDSSGNASSWSWYDSDIELMNEQMVYGGPCGSKPEASSINYNMGIDKSQLPLFALEPSRITNRAHWWLRSVVSATHFACVNRIGYAGYYNASNAYGVRPCFGICKANPS